MTFESDVAREIAAYEAAETTAERDDSMRSENSDYAVNGEAATLIPANDVLDADLPGARVYGPGHVEYIADQYGDPWGRFEF